LVRTNALRRRTCPRVCPRHDAAAVSKARLCVAGMQSMNFYARHVLLLRRRLLPPSQQHPCRFDVATRPRTGRRGDGPRTPRPLGRTTIAATDAPLDPSPMTDDELPEGSLAAKVGECDARSLSATNAADCSRASS